MRSFEGSTWLALLYVIVRCLFAATVKNQECRLVDEAFTSNYRMTASSLLFFLFFRVQKRFLNDSTIDNVELMPAPIHWPTVGLQPPVCRRQSLFFVVVVHSAVGNFDRRQRLRALWPESLKAEVRS